MLQDPRFSASTESHIVFLWKHLAYSRLESIFSSQRKVTKKGTWKKLSCEYTTNSIPFHSSFFLTSQVNHSFWIRVKVVVNEEAKTASQMKIHPHQKRHQETGKMSQLAKYLMCRCENLCLILGTYIKAKLSNAREVETVGLLGFPGQPAKLKV